MGNSGAKPCTMPQEGAARFSKLEEEITCSLCLCELTDPVSIICGHTFCKACITKYWSTPPPLGYRCPECRRICPKDQLIPVYRLQNMIEKVQIAVKEEQARQEAASALHLVYSDHQGRLQLDESVLQRCFLEGEVAGYPLCLICVIGEKRKGKSTLMNYILRALHSLEAGQPIGLGLDDEDLVGFDWRNGADGLTKGIWIWSRPFILERSGEKMAVFVLDTEGSLDIEGNRENCIKLSTLSMLLSSYLIFNVSNCLKTTELDYLEMYLHVSELTGTSLSIQYLQHLDILVRDWQEPDNCGREAARDYLEREREKLRLLKDSAYRRVLDTLRSPSVSGFLLPHPGKRFLRSGEGRLADMDDDFRGHLRRYISDLVAGIWLFQKTDIRDERITCAKVGAALKEFVGILRKEEYKFGSPMEMFYSLENRKYMTILLKRFQDFMDQQVPAGTSPFKVLGVRTSQMRSIVDEQASILLDTYEHTLQGENAAEKELLMNEMKALLAEKQEKFCAEYSKRFTKCAVVLGCVVGGGVLSLAGGIAGAAVAGTVLAAEAVGLLGSTTAAVVGGAVGGSVTLGAIGSSVGAGVGGVIGHVEEKKDPTSERGPKAEESTSDTHDLVDK
ncbi:RING finger protein 112-like isoform X1 [Hyperolius riggenbachi]|uniref:RING finger protein 112-like isoform X1 n=2 Tax=Hyperolius riggenbachi TaxID=752182 RepID=UPI0035A2B944